MKKTILVLGLVFLISLVFAYSATRPFRFGIKGSSNQYEKFKNAILLSKGWNGFGMIPNMSTLIEGDITYNLSNSSSGTNNFLGYSAIKSTNVNDIIFYKQDGSQLTYQDAKANNWIVGINLTSTNLSGDIVFHEPKKLSKNDAYWLKSYLAVNITYPNVHGSAISETFAWSQLRFHNGTDEMNITGAGSEDWVTTTLQYWDTSNDGFRYVCSYVYSGQRGEDSNCLSNSLSSWQGYFVKSNYDNIYMLFGNETHDYRRFGIRPRQEYSSGVKRFSFMPYLNENDFT